MFKSIPKKRTTEITIRQASRPDLAHLNEYLLQAIECAGECIKFTWSSREANQEYELSVQAFEGKGEPEWNLSLIKGHQNSTCLWSYSTCDVLLIHNLIVSSCDDAGQAVRAEGAIAVSQSFRQSSRNDGAYFVKADHTESQENNDQAVLKSIPSQQVAPAEVYPTLGQSNAPEVERNVVESASAEVSQLENLLEIAKEQAAPTPAEMPAKIVDRSMIDAIQQCLRDVKTGFHFYPAFLYELEQEYIRCFRTGAPISIILIRVQFANDPERKLEPLELAEIARTLSSLKRGSDLIAHYENGDLAVLLPDTAGQGARVFARRIEQGLTQPPYINADGDIEFKVQIGVASIPEDCKNLGVLLAVAESWLS